MSSCSSKIQQMPIASCLLRIPHTWSPFPTLYTLYTSICHVVCANGMHCVQTVHIVHIVDTVHAPSVVNYAMCTMYTKHAMSCCNCRTHCTCLAWLELLLAGISFYEAGQWHHRAPQGHHRRIVRAI